jgi:hypothetical protein
MRLHPLALAMLAALPFAAPRPQPAPARTLDASRAITYFVADGNPRSGYRASDRQLALWALDAWHRASGNRLRFETASENEALVRVFWAESNGGQYGEMRGLIVGGQRGAAVYIRPDVDALGDAVAAGARSDALLRDTIVYLTCLHELGHALGLAHTADFRDIMYYFGYGGDVVRYFDRYRMQLHARSDIARVSGLSDGDLARLRMLYPPG